MNDLDYVRELVAKIRAAQPNSTDAAYWNGYLACYCAQNAITDEELSREFAQAKS